MWFAFKLCSLYIWLQQGLICFFPYPCCDLLSNFALCTFDYNVDNQQNIWLIVVICFQTLLFVHLITTISAGESDWLSCDLLSNFALCTFDYNNIANFTPVIIVVICFQTLLFVHLITTGIAPWPRCKKLWFAFKLCSLYIWLQHGYFYSIRKSSCDLLSNFALCTFDYNSNNLFLCKF